MRGTSLSSPVAVAALVAICTVGATEREPPTRRTPCDVGDSAGGTRAAGLRCGRRGSGRCGGSCWCHRHLSDGGTHRTGRVDGCSRRSCWPRPLGAGDVARSCPTGLAAAARGGDVVALVVRRLSRGRGALLRGRCGPYATDEAGCRVMWATARGARDQRGGRRRRRRWQRRRTP